MQSSPTGPHNAAMPAGLTLMRRGSSGRLIGCAPPCSRIASRSELERQTDVQRVGLEIGFHAATTVQIDVIAGIGELILSENRIAVADRIIDTGGHAHRGPRHLIPECPRPRPPPT